MAIRGGKGLDAALDRIVAKLTSANTLRVGFLEGAMYPARSVTADKLLKGLDKLNATGPFRKGKKPAALRKYRKTVKAKAITFVGPSKPAIVLPVATIAAWNNFGNGYSAPRPFFSDMIAERSPTWGGELAKVLVASGYNTKIALSRMGVVINDQLVKKIVDWPADNAPLTVAMKGFNKGLVETGVMQRSTGFEVLT